MILFQNLEKCLLSLLQKSQLFHETPFPIKITACNYCFSAI